MSALFTPLRVGTLALPNRIVIAPMCQYSAVNGCMTDWHLIHLGHLALSGAALLTIERPPSCPTHGSPTPMWDSGTTRQKPRSPGCWKASAADPTCRLPSTGTRRSQGLDGGTVERRGADRIRSCKRLADGRAVCDPVPGRPAPAGRPGPTMPHAGA